MLLTFKQTGEEDPTRYIMGLKTSSGNKRTTAPQVVRGNTRRFIALHGNVPFGRKDTRTAISYHADDDPTETESLLDIDCLERVAFAGIPPDEYESLWIRHRQQNKVALRTDIHGLWLRQLLSSGLSYNPYYHHRDLHLFDLTKRIINSIRGYEEPSAPEHSRISGFTIEGSRAHELDKIVQDICQKYLIKSREDLANELDRRGYAVVRKATGRPRGRKSITVQFPDGDKVKLVGSPVTPVKRPTFTQPQEELVKQVQIDLDELNRRCFIRAKRNWNRYRKRTSRLSEQEAEQAGYGFTPITLDELIPRNPNERKQRRTGLYAGAHADRSEREKRLSSQPDRTLGGEDQIDGLGAPEVEQPLAVTSEGAKEHRSPFEQSTLVGGADGLKESVGQAHQAIGAAIKKLTVIAKQKLQNDRNRSRETP